MRSQYKGRLPYNKSQQFKVNRTDAPKQWANIQRCRWMQENGMIVCVAVSKKEKNIERDKKKRE